jgi:hypothetical protein
MEINMPNCAAQFNIHRAIGRTDFCDMYNHSALQSVRMS